MTVPAWLKGTLLLTATLAAGVAIGVVLERQRAPRLDAAQVQTHHVMRQLQRHLDLDSSQHAAIVAILARRQRAMDSTWHAVLPPVRAAMDSTHLAIAAVLRPDQLAKYREMVESMHGGAMSPAGRR